MKRALLRCKALGANVKDTKYSLQNQCIVLQCRCNIDAVPLQLFAVLLQRLCSVTAKMCSRFAVRACDEKAMGVLSFCGICAIFVILVI